ncbi:MAG: GLPGLI family protein [Chitinophagaceae bacterium]
MQNRCYFFLLLFSCMAIGRAKAQNETFLTQGNITYEKTVNSLALIQERWGNDDDGWSQQLLDAYKKSGYKFTKTQFNLAFSNGKTLYTPVIDDAPSGGINDFNSTAKDNTVYSDLQKQQSVSLKNVFEEHFLITDTTRQIQWKITDELRDIAGFPCRRANAVIMDSVYVVAFFTDAIITPGGPESFNGLPGMILGVALPHEHTTWFATKVSVAPRVPEMSLKPPTKGKPYNNKDYFNLLQGRLKSWGKEGAVIVQNAML